MAEEKEIKSENKREYNIEEPAKEIHLIPQIEKDKAPDRLESKKKKIDLDAEPGLKKDSLYVLPRKDLQIIPGINEALYVPTYLVDFEGEPEIKIVPEKHEVEMQEIKKEIQPKVEEKLPEEKKDEPIRYKIGVPLMKIEANNSKIKKIKVIAGGVSGFAKIRIKPKEGGKTNFYCPQSKLKYRIYPSTYTSLNIL